MGAVCGQCAGGTGALRIHLEDPAGCTERRAGLYAGGKSGTAENGGGKAANAVFAGFLQDSDYPLAFIVVVEEGGGGASVCTPILSQVLSACVVAMDAD